MVSSTSTTISMKPSSIALLTLDEISTAFNKLLLDSIDILASSWQLAEFWIKNNTTPCARKEPSPPLFIASCFSFATSVLSNREKKGPGPWHDNDVS
eukprot:3778696-Ditylum_brightwellii.AAC.1